MGVGYAVKLGAKDQLSPYAQLFWIDYGNITRQLAGNTFRFAGIDSLRSVLGAQWQHQLNEQSHFYTSVAWEREHRGTAKGQTLNLALPEPSLKGNSGIVGAGFALTPKENLSINLGVEGSFGKRQGVGVSGKIHYLF